MEMIHPVVKDLVLVGGGHAHVLLLKRLGMKPIPGLRVTLISPDYLTPYSGMLPGVVAGHYTSDDIHIDLAPLCRFAGAQFIQARVTDFDPYSRRVEIEDRPGLNYDAISLDIGITPDVAVPGAGEYAIPVKPISEFLTKWQDFLQRYQSGAISSIALVGGGAGGVELTLAVHAALSKLSQPLPEFHLVSASNTILEEFSPDTRARFLAEFRAKDIQLHTGARVSEVTEEGVKNDFGGMIHADETFWVTSAASQSWLGKTGLELDKKGFIKTTATLQSTNFDSVFAVGDIAANQDHPRPKAGVFAVRQGPVLYNNIKRYLLGKATQPFKPQKEFLSLVSTGGKSAVGVRGPMTVQGDWVWRLKNSIDQRFMNQFKRLQKMPSKHGKGLLANLDEQMRCGGCGAKVSAELLTEVLRDAGVNTSGLDDAAVYEPPPGKQLLHTVDSFKTFTPDTYRFGRIAVQHALSDIYAMGGEPVTALAIMTVPYGTPGKVRNTLEQLIAGSLEALKEANVSLIGGHTAEGAELSLGFAVNGLIESGQSLTKTGLKEGDALILTKALGTGTVLAADMQYAAKGSWVEAAHISMEQSNQAAGEIFARHRATACTDVTGFGLAGHLLEMLKASHCSAVVTLENLPVLEGAGYCMNQLNIQSTLHEANVASCPEVSPVNHRNMPLVFDPQTSGGLLAGIHTDQVDLVMGELKAAGYPAAVIGRVSSTGQAHLFFE